MEKQFRDGSIRMIGYDYGSDGYYFVTICTKGMKKYLGHLSAEKFFLEDDVRTYQDTSMINDEKPIIGMYPDTSVLLTTIGLIAYRYWLAIPEHFPFVKLDSFVIMPDHLHGIVYLDTPDKIDWTPNEFRSQSNTVGSVIKQYKGSVKRYANQNGIEFEWKLGYHDRIVRTLKDLESIRKYIRENPWKTKT